MLYVTADCVIFSFDGVSVKVLLIKRGIELGRGLPLDIVIIAGLLHDICKQQNYITMKIKSLDAGMLT